MSLRAEEEAGLDTLSKEKSWVHPSAQWVKCNTALSNKNRFGGGAWVVRGEDGQVIAYSRKVF